MNSPNSENSAISSSFLAISLVEYPFAKALNRILSLPVSCGLKPIPTDNRVVTSPYTDTRPFEGGRIPAIVRSNVDLPAPL